MQRARVIAAHRAPDRPPIRIATGDPVTLGERDSDWPNFVWTTLAQGLGGWIPAVLFDNDIGQATEALRALGHAAGMPQAASRQTPRGLLAWQIGLRPDGQRLLQGLLPTLIEWGEQHPEASLADKGIALQQLQLLHPDAPAMQSALQALGLDGNPALQVMHAPSPALVAHLHTPQGPVQLRSPV